MTVLEQDKTGPTMSDRYITPEYLAHLPTSVSTTVTPTTNHFYIIMEIICLNKSTYPIISLDKATQALSTCPYVPTPRPTLPLS